MIGLELKDVTYGEVKDFFDNMKNFEKAEIYMAFMNYKEDVELKNKILSMFPKDDKHKYELIFIDKEKHLGIITIFSDNNPIAYVPYLANKGLYDIHYKTYDEAIFGCLLFKILENTDKENHPKYRNHIALLSQPPHTAGIFSDTLFVKMKNSMIH